MEKIDKIIKSKVLMPIIMVIAIITDVCYYLESEWPFAVYLHYIAICLIASVVFCVCYLLFKLLINFENYSEKLAQFDFTQLASDIATLKNVADKHDYMPEKLTSFDFTQLASDIATLKNVADKHDYMPEKLASFDFNQLASDIATLKNVADKHDYMPEKLTSFDFTQLASDISALKNNSELDKIYMDNAYYADEKLCSLISKERPNEIKELHLICYGRNGFGGEYGPVQTVIRENLNIQVEIIVFNPESYNDICLKSDKDDIHRHIIKWNNNSDKIKVYATNIPPMIRAAVAYSKDDNGKLHAVWGKIQAYRFRYDFAEKKFTPEKYKHSLIAVADERCSIAEDFNMLVQCFEEEYTRLKENSSEAAIGNDNKVTLLPLKK